MGRRQEKANRLTSVQLLLKARQLRPDQAVELEAMLRRCRTEAEFKQVSEIVHQTCLDNRVTRYGKIMSGEPFEDLDDD